MDVTWVSLSASTQLVPAQQMIQKAERDKTKNFGSLQKYQEGTQSVTSLHKKRISTFFSPRHISPSQKLQSF